MTIYALVRTCIVGLLSIISTLNFVQICVDYDHHLEVETACGVG